MRHYKNKVTLDRKTGPRKALLNHLAESLILMEKITTTRAKAMAVKRVVEKLITRSKTNTLANRRELLSKLHSVKAVKKLMEVIGGRYKDRQGGYTRIIRLGFRRGDGAEQVIIELV